MGSPISSLFADLVLDDLETECLKKLSFTPLFFYRYTDDIITCIPFNEIDSMLEIFNSYEQRLQFTHDVEIDNEISFLDVLLLKNNDTIETNWYTKSTLSGRFLNFHSKHSCSQKIAMIYNLVDSAINLCNEKFHDENIEKVKSLLIQNDYPKWLIEKFIKIRIEKLKSDFKFVKNERSKKNA